jgi:regulator of protease activity HflC (stomatin/prohibitin superfamily)
LESTAVSGDDYENKKGIERYVVPDGYRGIQQSVLGPGRYYLNLVAYTPYLIPTTNITIDWANNQNESRPFNTDYTARSSEVKTPTTLLDPLSIVSNDGFQMQVEVKVIIRILPEQAPHMLGRIGTVRNLVDNVIHPLIDSSFRNQASATAAMQFLQNRHQEQEKARIHVGKELEKYHVECVSVLICQIKLPESLMQTLTRKVVASQQMAMFDAQEEAEGRRKEMERTRAQAEMQPNLVKAELDVQIANQRKSEQIILAEGKSESTRLEQAGIAAGLKSVGLAEAIKIGAIGKATAEAYQQQVAALGKDSLSLIEVMKKISDSGIKITPDVLVQSGSDASGMQSVGELLSALMAKNLQSDSGSDTRAS